MQPWWAHPPWWRTPGRAASSPRSSHDSCRHNVLAPFSVFLVVPSALALSLAEAPPAPSGLATTPFLSRSAAWLAILALSPAGSTMASQACFTVASPVGLSSGRIARARAKASAAWRFCFFSRWQKRYVLVNLSIHQFNLFTHTNVSHTSAPVPNLSKSQMFVEILHFGTVDHLLRLNSIPEHQQHFLGLKISQTT